MKQGIVYRCAGGPLNYQGWPSVCRDENGILYAAWSGGRAAHICPFGKTYLSKSRNGGETWSSPTVINDTMLDDRDAGLCYLGGGKMILTYFTLSEEYFKNCLTWIDKHSGKFAYDMISATVEDVYSGYSEAEKQWGSFVRISEDYGETWSEPIQLPVTAPHGAVLTKSGRLLYVGKQYNPQDDAPRGDIMLYESFDGGRLWSRVSVLPVPAGFDLGQLHEPHIAELPDGTLFAAVRLHDPAYGQFSMYYTRSADGGKTWSEPQHSEKNGAPPHLLVLKDGRLLLAYTRRTAPLTTCAEISTDGGKTWGEPYTLSISLSSDHGYPCTVQLDDGSFVTVYYQKYENDPFASILHTKWEA